MAPASSFRQAIQSGGATELRPLADQFYGDRTVALEDPFSHKWTLATHVEDVSWEEIQRRSKSPNKKAEEK